MDNNMNPFNGGNGNGSGNGSQGPNGSGGSEQNNPRRTSLILLAIAAIVTLISMSLFMRMINNATNQEITYGKFQELVEDGKAAEVTWDDDTIYLKLQQTNQKTLFSAMPEVTYYTGKAQSDDALTAYLKEYKVASYGKDVPDSSGLILTMILTYVLPIVVMWLLLSLLFRRMGGGGPMGVGKSNAKVYVQKETGITATAGIGTNLYLAKIAMDIMAKHIEPDADGVRIAKLDEMSYRRYLWGHRPLTDFWRVGRGYAKKLEERGIYTMGDIARCSLGKENDYYNEDLLYRMFGVNAELLIDHAWGYEPCTIADVKAYQPENHSVGSGQVLACPYTVQKARLVVREMADLLALDLVEKKLTADQVVLTVGYDIENLTDSKLRKNYSGEISTDRYGRRIPKHAHGSRNLGGQTSSTKRITEAVMELYDEIMNPKLLVRRIAISANHVVCEGTEQKVQEYEQLNLFTDYGTQVEQKKKEEEELAREKRMQQAVLGIKKKFGKNAVLKGMNLEEGATAVTRNNQIGGHRA